MNEVLVKIPVDQATKEHDSEQQGTHGILDAVGGAGSLSQGRGALLWI